MTGRPPLLGGHWGLDESIGCLIVLAVVAGWGWAIWWVAEWFLDRF